MSIDYETFDLPDEPDKELITVPSFAGVNKNPDMAQISLDESPDAMNTVVDRDGTLDRRTGTKNCLPVSLGDGAVHDLIFFEGKLLVAHGTKIYEFDKEEVE